jgi:membrane protein
MKFTFKNIWSVLKQTFTDFAALGITRMAAALAYYTVFSIAPMLLVIITICSIFFGREAIEGRIYHQIASFVGSDAATQIQLLIKNAALSPHFTLASVIGVITLILSATGVFAEIQSSINTIWRLKANPKKGGIIKIVLTRLLSFSMIVSLGFILMVSLIVNAAMDALVDRLTQIFPGITIYLTYAINIILTFITTSILFAIIFKVLPDARIKFKDIRAGAFTTALLFMIGRAAIGFYLGHSKVSSTYGAAGSLVVILLWVYYSAIILYFGAAFTKAYVSRNGGNIYPNEYAVFVENIEVENKGSLGEQKAEPKTAVKKEEVDIKKSATKNKV